MKEEFMKRVTEAKGTLRCSGSSYDSTNRIEGIFTEKNAKIPRVISAPVPSNPGPIGMRPVLDSTLKDTEPPVSTLASRLLLARGSKTSASTTASGNTGTKRFPRSSVTLPSRPGNPISSWIVQCGSSVGQKICLEKMIQSH